MGRLTPFLDDILLGAVLVLVFAVWLPRWLPFALLGLLAWVGAKLWLFRAHLRRPVIGPESTVGRVATALEDLSPSGDVDLDGERWRAESREPARAGERVQVEAVEGLLLRVAPLGLAGGTLHEPRRGSVLLGLAARLRGR